VAWYAPATVEVPSSRGVAAFGLIVTNEISATASMELWPENVAVWTLFRQIGNQWRRGGMNGMAFSLDYGVLFHRMDRLRLNDRDYEETFELIKAMERAALNEMNRDTE
jgi:hypothetical protein